MNILIPLLPMESAANSGQLFHVVSSFRLSGFLSFDVVVSGMDFNQCEHPPSWDMHSPPSSSSSQLSSFSGSQQPISYFNSTHKCHNETSTVNTILGRTLSMSIPANLTL